MALCAVPRNTVHSFNNDGDAFISACVQRAASSIVAMRISEEALWMTAL